MSKNGAYIRSLIQSERPNTFIHQINKQMDFAPFSGLNANMALLSNSPKLEKMFARFDLDSIQERSDYLSFSKMIFVTKRSWIDVPFTNVKWIIMNIELNQSLILYKISFVGLLGDLAIWAITDLSTGEIQYVVDDSWGSEILDLLFLKW